MTESDLPDVREALQRVHESMTRLFEELVEPYAAMASTEPELAIGTSARVPRYARPVEVREVAARIRRNGRGAWALLQVHEREQQIQQFLSELEGGLYGACTAGEWMDMIARFRDAVIADLHTAMQDPRGWDRLRLGGTAAAAEEAVLTPRDVAGELHLSERTVRRRIQEGELGPWEKRGGRWIIERDAFFHHWARQLGDSDVPRPPSAAFDHDEVEARVEHVRLGTSNGP